MKYCFFILLLFVLTACNPKEEVQIRSIMNLCLSFDHRIIDGAEAAFFLQSIKKNLESFDKDYKII